MPSDVGATVGVLGFGDVVLVPFPFTDQSATKQRPAVVVSREGYNRARPDVILMAITSQVRAAAGMDEIRLNAGPATGLLKPSIIKPIIMTLERGLVLRKLGELAAAEQLLLRQAIQAMLG